MLLFGLTLLFVQVASGSKAAAKELLEQRRKVFAHECATNYLTRQRLSAYDDFLLTLHRVGAALCRASGGGDGGGGDLSALRQHDAGVAVPDFFAPVVSSLNWSFASKATQQARAAQAGVDPPVARVHLIAQWQRRVFLLRGAFPAGWRLKNDFDAHRLRVSIAEALREAAVPIDAHYAHEHAHISLISYLSLSRKFETDETLRDVASGAAVGATAVGGAAAKAGAADAVESEYDPDNDPQQELNENARVLAEMRAVANMSDCDLQYMPMKGSSDYVAQPLLLDALVRDVPLWLEDRPAQVVDVIERTIERALARSGVSFVYLHCMSGVDRTGSAVAAYMLHHNVSLTRVLALAALIKSENGDGLNKERSAVWWPSVPHMNTIRWYHAYLQQQRQRREQ